jgi:hypothetical protein
MFANSIVAFYIHLTCQEHCKISKIRAGRWYEEAIKMYCKTRKVEDKKMRGQKPDKLKRVYTPLHISQFAGSGTRRGHCGGARRWGRAAVQW